MRAERWSTDQFIGGLEGVCQRPALATRVARTLNPWPTRSDPWLSLTLSIGVGDKNSNCQLKMFYIMHEP